MSIDPAIDSSQILKDALSFDDLNISPDAVYAFDFDGVISSRFEDDIYRLPPTDDEIELLSAAAKHFRIRCEDMEQRYQRHLIYQAAAWKLKLQIEPGFGFAKAKQASDSSRLFVLTARSGWHAVERLRDFFRNQNIIPIETYNVGRVKKDRQIELLCREFPMRKVYFIEDSTAHLADVARFNFANLGLVFLQSGFDIQPEDEYLRVHFQKVVRDALK
jgi:hypothetical protein